MNESPAPDSILNQAFARLDKTALGVAIGALFGGALFLATNVLLLRGGDPVGPNLALLGQYFIGYSVTFGGSWVGLAYGFGTGFIMGWLAAVLHNLFLTVYFYVVQFKANMSSISSYIDPDRL